MKQVRNLCSIGCGVVMLLVISGGWAMAADKLTPIADNIYAYVDTTNASKADSFGANAGVIIGDDGVLVVDTLMSAKEGQRFIRDIRSVTDKPIKYVVNTHYHLDHAFGNCEFVRLGAVLIAQENAKKAMEAGAGETLKNIAIYGLTPEEMEGTVPAYPVLTYGDRMEIDLGGQKVVLIHARHAHTGGDTMVYVPAAKVLFAGDILFTNYHPFLGEGDIPEWTRELDEIAAMDVEKIIPGHGPVSGQKDLADMKEYLLAFDEHATELAASSSDVEAIVAEIEKLLPQRPEGRWLISGNIQMKYLKK